MSFFFMDCLTWDGELRELEPGSPISTLAPGAFNRGQRIPTAVPRPIHWNLSPGKGELPVYFDSPALVVRKDFAEALSRCGVDNIDYYEVVLHDVASGQEWSDYLIANVIGDVDAIDMKRSEIAEGSPPTTAVLFENIVVDDSKARGFKLFRPRHKHSALLVSDELRRCLAAGQFANLEFTRPEDHA